MARDIDPASLDYPIGENVAARLRDLQTTVAAIALGRVPCPKGTRRAGRLELSKAARECCIRLGISWAAK